jgi:thymidylate synthase
MNNLDARYQALLEDILQWGVEKKDRTGTGTISVFGRQIRHKMSEGFPLLTTKKMHWNSIVTELLWFLRGETNIKFLLDYDCNIWNGDAYKRYVNSLFYNFSGDVKGYVVHEHLSKEEFINKIKTDDEFAKKWGELGPIYGKQWRNWINHDLEIPNGNGLRYMEKQTIDQIANLINDLKTNPDSRRLMVNAWNVGELDQMVLPPCHYGFQVYTRELSLEERAKWLQDNKGYDLLVGNLEHDHIREVVENESPTRAISLMWNQRSVDTFLGLPFNIASYGLLLHIIANEVNMVPDELIGNLGDTHLYSNHIEQAKEQIGRTLTFNERYALYTGNDKTWEEGGGNAYGKISGLDIMDDAGIPTRTRQPFELPKLEILDSKVDNISHYEINDFVLKNYQSHPAIKAPLSN